MLRLAIKIMGNCLALQDKVIKVMKTDGEVLIYKVPLKVGQVLSDYAGHAISDTLPVVRHLRRDTDLVGGQLYYLLPLPLIPSLKISEKKISCSKLELTEAGDGHSGVVRIKLVMSKQELEAMLRKGGVSVGDLVSRIQENESSRKSEDLRGEGNGNSRVWKPLLESIPEFG